MNNIKVRIGGAYGKEFIYPMCEKAELFCKIAGAKSLTRAQIEYVKALGFGIEVVPEIKSL